MFEQNQGLSLSKSDNVHPNILKLLSYLTQQTWVTEGYASQMRTKSS